MLNKIAIFFVSLFISVIIELILLLFVFGIYKISVIWAISSFPLLLILIFIILYKNYSNSNYHEEIIDCSIIKSNLTNINQINKIDNEYNVSTEYLKKIKSKIIIELVILSPVLILSLMLIITAVSESKISPIFPMFCCFVVAITSGLRIFEYYNNLFKEVRELKAIFSSNKITIFRDNKNLEVIDLNDIDKINVKRNIKSNLIDCIQLSIAKADNIKTNIKLEGYRDMDLILKQLTHAQ